MKVLSVDNTQAFEPSSLERRLRNSVASFGEIYHYAIDPDAYSVLLQNLNNLADDVVRIALNKSPLPTSRIFFDIKFIEDGKTIDLISIGMVRESDGAEYYAQNINCELSLVSDFVDDPKVWKQRSVIASEIVQFVGPNPEFWTNFYAYNWVVLCQLYGTIIDLPKGWPMFCFDIQQEAHRLGIHQFIVVPEAEQNALVNARRNMRIWKVLHT